MCIRDSLCNAPVAPQGTYAAKCMAELKSDDTCALVAGVAEASLSCGLVCEPGFDIWEDLKN